MLSLIIPCYNEEGAIEDIVKRCDAVLRDEDEIIVVNDGSDDNGKTRNIAKSYGKEIIYIEKENEGISTALN
jgi:hypothetical protein